MYRSILWFMPKIPYTKEEIEPMITEEEQKLLNAGYAKEDVEILRKGLDCLVWPKIEKIYRIDLDFL